MVNQTGRESKGVEKSEVISIGQKRDGGATWEVATRQQQAWWTELKEQFSDFAKWLGEIVLRGTKLKDYIFIRSLYFDKDDRWVVKIRFFTDEYCYAITVCKSSEKRRSYMGCLLSCRKARTGEEWSRGCDLPDGDYTRKTWEAIKNAVIKQEIQKLNIQWKAFTIDKVVKIDTKEALNIITVGDEKNLATEEDLKQVRDDLLRRKQK